MGLAPGASPDRLRFLPSVEEAATAADFVQENGPERLDVKRDLLAGLDAAAAPHVVLASTSSTLMMTEVQGACAHPGRVVLGHPFNPPHLIPLVEVCGWRDTVEDAVAAAMAFYTVCGKHPIRLRREMRGHVANRLQAALWQEAIHLVREGVASVADIDAAISHGPGLRWALLRPFLNLHLSGGPGGIGHMLDHLGPPTEAMWRDLGRVTLDGPTKAAIAGEVGGMVAACDLPAVVRERGAVLADLLQRKAAGILP